jgi:hypothetical protein
LSAIVAAALWLAEKLGDKALDTLLTPEDESQRQTLLRALQESQQERDELREVGRLLEVVAAQRDALFAENQRLQHLVAALEARLARQQP